MIRRNRIKIKKEEKVETNKATDSENTVQAQPEAQTATLSMEEQQKQYAKMLESYGWTPQQIAAYQQYPQYYHQYYQQYAQQYPQQYAQQYSQAMQQRMQQQQQQQQQPPPPPPEEANNDDNQQKQDKQTEKVEAKEQDKTSSQTQPVQNETDGTK